MSDRTGAKAVRPCSVRDLIRRFRPVCEHLAAAQREVLLAARSVIDAEVEILEEWRARHADSAPTTRINAG